MQLLDYLFRYYAYDIGCRMISEGSDLPSNANRVKISILKASERYWYADPFGFERENKLYIFLEIMDIYTGKGTIGYTIFSNGTFSPVREVLSEPFHLSYPNVFENNGGIYMLPETCHANQIRLYRAVEFPEKWELEKVLATDINVVDASFLWDDEGELWLYAKEFNVALDCEGNTRWFKVNKNSFDLTEVQVQHFASQRPGGNAFYIGKDAYRPLQDCSTCYGEKVLLYKTTDINNLSKPDILSHIINPDMFTCNRKKKYERIHTFNRTQNYEIVDFCYNRFYITKPLHRLVRAIKAFLERN